MPPRAFRPELRDIWTAFGLLTRLPLPYPAFDAQDPRPAAHAAWAYPLTGVAVAGVIIIAGYLALALGLPPSAAAFIGFLGGILSTGALHEDGLADCADGFWGGWTRERRLEIMKDSQIGTYGVIALIVSLGLRWAALATLMLSPSWPYALIGAAIVSRAGMVWVMYALPVARASGLSGRTGRPPIGATLTALAIGTVALLITPAPLTGLLALSLIVTFIVGRIAKAKIGGQTGDVLGATQQMLETALLLACLSASI